MSTEITVPVDKVVQVPGLKTLKEARADFDKKYITLVWRKSKQNVTQAATIAGVSRVHMYLLLDTHGIMRKVRK